MIIKPTPPHRKNPLPMPNCSSLIYGGIRLFHIQMRPGATSGKCPCCNWQPPPALISSNWQRRFSHIGPVPFHLHNSFVFVSPLLQRSGTDRTTIAQLLRVVGGGDVATPPASAVPSPFNRQAEYSQKMSPRMQMSF